MRGFVATDRRCDIPVTSRRSWIEETFYKRECVKFIPACRDLHRCSPVCQVCQNIIRCCCGRLVGEHPWLDSGPPLSLCPGAAQEEDWSVECHTRASATDAYGTIEFQDSAKRACRAKYVRVAVDAKADALLQLMLREWQMERPKLLLTVHGGGDNFPLPPKVRQAFGQGLVKAAQSTGAWILTDGINTGVSRYVGEAVKAYGSHDPRRRNAVGVTSWGAIENHWDLIGRDVLQPYQPLLGNPLSKLACLNGLHSHFLLVDDGTLGKHGCQQGLRRRLERHIQLQKIHPRLKQGVPAVCVVVEGGPGVVGAVLEYVSSVPPVPVFVFEGSGRAADLLAFLHKQTATDRQLDADIQEDFLLRIGSVFGLERAEAAQLYDLLMECMDHRQSISIFDSESEEHQEPDAAILTATLKGTKATAAEQLSTALAWDRADIAKKHVLVYGQRWQVGSLEQAMLHALLMDRVNFVKLLIDNGMTMNHFLSVARLEELYNTPQGPTDSFLKHLVEDVKQTHLHVGYRVSLIDVGLVLEYLIGGAYRSMYTRKHFRAAYNRLHGQSKEPGRDSSGPPTRARRAGGAPQPNPAGSPLRPHFFRTAQPYRHKERGVVSPDTRAVQTSEREDSPLFVYNFNDLFAWAVLQRRQQMALFLWQHGEEALARATVACKLYRSMAHEARQSNTDDSTAEQLKTFSLEFGQLAVDVLDCAFRQNERMAMKLLTSEMECWSRFTCLQMAISSGLRPLVSHSCTQTLLTDLWTGRLNMRKNSCLKIILSLLLPPAILLLEFKSHAQMCHVPQSQFERDTAKPADAEEARPKGVVDVERGPCGRGRGPVSESASSLSCHWLLWTRRFYEFYTAPVVKFWFHTISYLVFLMLFSYTVLVKMEDQPSPQEWMVIAYILSTALEKIREVMMSEPRKLSKKLKVWFGEYWNVLDFLAILLFLAGLTLRWHGGAYLTAGRISYCLDIIFWFVRVLDLLAVNQHAGPYLTMITKMTSNMFCIVVMMAIVLLSFGVSRKAILSPDEEPSWSLARDVVNQPYWMMFGEVYAGEIDACAKGKPCPPGSFLTPLLQAVYLFFQYIIMVNILIAFFNNVYFDMTSMSNKLWKYNRYRYIMTYQEKPWLPPPLSILSHMTLCVSSIYRRHRGSSKQERDSGLKLYLCREDLKRVHEFEERCVLAYFLEKNQSVHCSQISRVRATSERAEEMRPVLGEVAEKVLFIQDSLQVLDGQLGQLQDLSALAVDTLTLLSASVNLQRGEQARLAHHRPIARSLRLLPRSWDLAYGGGAGDVTPKAYRSTPPSLLRGHAPGSRRLSLEWHGEAWGGRGWGAGRTEEAEPEDPEGGGLRDSTSPPSPHPITQPWACDLQMFPSQEGISMEEEEEEDEEEGDRKTSSVDVSSRASSRAVLLSDPRDAGRGGHAGGLVNPAFCGDDGRTGAPRHGQWGRTRKCPRWACLSREPAGARSRSLSASVENMALSSAPQSPLQVSFPALSDGLSGGRSLSKSREWSQSSEPWGTSGCRTRAPNKKTVKIQEEDDSVRQADMRSHLSDACWRGKGRRGAESACWSASASLNQLNFEPMEWFQKLTLSHQDSRSPSQSVWNSWARSHSHRASVQGGIAPEAKSSTYQSTGDLHPHYSAMERNNLMRLAHTIPFTPVSLLAGEEVSVFTLEETGSDTASSAGGVSSWSSRGLSAMLQPLSNEGSLDGGLRRATRVLCTWAEGAVLRPGAVYVVKAFRPEVVRTWQRLFNNDTPLQLCLREIQQQRAAQKLMQVFNTIKPVSVPHSPRFLDVFLVLWHADGQWLTMERNMSGDFRKYNNNTGEEIAPCWSLEETLLAFSHWTYQYSCGELLVLDIQGVGEELTDPSVIRAEDKSSITGDDMVFGAANLGDAAIHSFLLKHTCNICCHRLGLSDLKRRRVDSNRRTRQTSEEEEEEEEEKVTRL